MILTAHYDTVFTDGANDNGSGVATLLEAARVLAGLRFQHDITFVFVEGEEIGPLGSVDCVNRHESEISDAIGAINIDSVASGSPDGLAIGFGPLYPEAWEGMWWGWSQSTTPEIDDLVSAVALEVVGYTPVSGHPEDIGGVGADSPLFVSEGIPTTDIGWHDQDRVSTCPAISDRQLAEGYQPWKTVDGTDYYYLPGAFWTNKPNLHTSYDVVSNVNAEYLADTIELTILATSRFAGRVYSILLPVAVSAP